MLVVYRTNKDFEGRIAALVRQQSMAEFAAWSAANPDVALAAVEVDTDAIDPALLADLALHMGTYTVVDGKLQRDGVAAKLGYTVDARASIGGMRDDPALKALFSMTDVQILNWVQANGAEAALVQIVHILRRYGEAIRAVV